MKKYSRFLSCLFSLAMGLAAPAALSAEAGVTDKEIVLGQSLGLTGPLAELAPDITHAAQAYFDAVNAGGGVNGRRIRTVVLDDGYQPANTLKTVRQLVEDEQVFALYSMTGTANVAGVLPMLAGEKPPVPVFAPFTGADVVRYPAMNNVFHIRASYADELEKLVQHLTTIGVQRIGVLWINNGMGQDGMAGIEKAMRKRAMKPYATASIQPDGSDTEKAVAELHDKRPEVIVMITTGVPTVSFIKSYNKLRKGMRFYTLSVMGTQATLRALGPDGVGVVVTSVVPFPWSQSSVLAREYRASMQKAGYDNLSFLGFESYINAKVLVEGLRRAGRDLTRAKFISALEGMRQLNLGGFEVGFSRESHQGSRFVELTIIGPGEKFAK
ncbi:ABC transporter substrate-binding protein [Variovorax terrae]|uniref:ABC transporter substrate-binding protein n=1 Tax=Variovorax terrae TaxID=2923278 RepID=A0A9X2AMF3_9BURK|nr:ABC transporter substrate-binding protein [Variovorax terrae]MCJ0763264.1 ABC transporter substrate-binding protein [Variovorax terrae]